MENKPLTIEDEIKLVNEDFKYNLRLLRTAKGLSGVEASEQMGMIANRVNDLEGGRMPPNITDLVKIVDFFDLSFDDLLDQRLSIFIPSQHKPHHQ